MLLTKYDFVKSLLFKNCNAGVCTKWDFMFKNVIVRRPSKSMAEGITSSPELGKPDYENAIKQHDSYVEAFKKLVENAGYEVITVDTSEYRKLDGGLSCLSLRF